MLIGKPINFGEKMKYQYYTYKNDVPIPEKGKTSNIPKGSNDREILMRIKADGLLEKKIDESFLKVKRVSGKFMILYKGKHECEMWPVGN
jgi:hypothetical protein